MVYVPAGSYRAYYVADNWIAFDDIREMGSIAISLNKKNAILNVGESLTLTASVTKADEVTIDSEVWYSNNPDIATVDEDGKVTAVANGNATISYTLTDGYGCPRTVYCEVEVIGNSGIDEIIFNNSAAPIRNDIYNLQGVCLKRNASEDDIKALAPGLYIIGGKKVLVR